jgi:hypothetical protein
MTTMSRGRRAGMLVMLGLAVVASLGSLACSRSRLGPQGAFQPATAVPTFATVRNLPGRGVMIEGEGTAQSHEVTPQTDGGITVGIDVITITHDGRSTFIVTAAQGKQTETVTSAIGAYRGQRPLVVQGPISFKVTADGAWTLKIQPMSSGGSPAFSGSGDAVSAYFTPPQAAAWDVAHDGQTNFYVHAHCMGGSLVVVDRSGAIQDTPQVDFPRGPCFWEVRADGAWSLKPSL